MATLSRISRSACLQEAGIIAPPRNPCQERAFAEPGRRHRALRWALVSIPFATNAGYIREAQASASRRRHGAASPRGPESAGACASERRGPSARGCALGGASGAEPSAAAPRGSIDAIDHAIEILEGRFRFIGSGSEQNRC
jgi:hypothetical protein